MAKQAKNFGIKALLKLYEVRLLLKGAKWPILISLILITVFIYKDGVNIALIEEVVGLVLNIIPSLLGFVLSGYALLIGFGNIGIIAKKKNPTKPTLYQKVSTVFAIGLIMQIALLVFAFVVKVLIKANLTCWIGCIYLCKLTNYAIFFLLVFGLLYVVIMIKDLVINIFNFSQVQHFMINKENETPSA
jgi:hypothetical protein